MLLDLNATKYSSDIDSRHCCCDIGHNLHQMWLMLMLWTFVMFIVCYVVNFVSNAAVCNVAYNKFVQIPP